ncbi:hypothetical protein [Pseudomonas putida]|uniref:Uncharacterized protein n=1 Tax=Pseudomonas putida TaxID=303 RepID=A0A1X0ZVS7_PSEPU|nr:hypothetical protein [Pseudomonas putida]ORL63813.1 hypothetical protein B7H17_13900 [Pseudomonas putida]
MRPLAYILGALALSSQVHATSTPPLSDTQPAFAEAPVGDLSQRGAKAARELNAWFAATPDDCGGPDKPAHLCSGLMLRATDTNPNFLPWDPSPGAIALGGVSFSWLRRDHTFARTWENWNGFIFYPGHATPPDRLDSIKVLCSFPINADTWQRPDLQGCGPMPDAPELTDTCQNLNIHSASDWLTKYSKTATTNKVCGWDIREGREATAAWFKASIDAHQGLTGLAWETFDELMLSSWRTGDGAQLPLHSFFYPARSLESRAKARIDQTRYFEQYGQTLPLIRLAFPQDRHATTVISFLEADQAVGLSAPRLEVDFEDIPPGSPADLVSGGMGFAAIASELIEIQDSNLGSPLITGNYLVVDNLLDFPVDPNGNHTGTRTVEFSWGCNSYCSVTELTSGRETVLVEAETVGPMRFGRHTVSVTAPEVIRLTSSMEDGSRIVLDNLTID